MYYLTVLVNSKIPVDIIRIYSSRIGHLCWNIDNYYNSEINQLILRRKIRIFILDERVANNAILKMIKRDLPGLYFTGRTAVFLSRLLEKNRWIKFCTPWQILHPNFSKCSESPQWIRIPSRKVQRFLKSHALQNKKIVVLHNRDNAYIDYFGGDNNYHDYRNFQFSDFSDSIDTLRKKDYEVIRIGLKADPRFDSLNIIDLSNENQEDWNDVAAVHSSAFFVSGNSGISHISNFFRKPHLFVNQIPYDLHHLSAMPKGSLFIPKKLMDNKTGKFLSLAKSIELFSRWTIHDNNFFEKNSIEIVNNTASEIDRAVADMIEMIEAKHIEVDLDVKLKLNLESSYGGMQSAKFIFGNLNIKIAPSFLKMHSHWLFGN
jgi:putative glycosyltransferase (TIGR04372 family)